jgi:hypothetical protein
MNTTRLGEALFLQYVFCVNGGFKMTFKIERTHSGKVTTLRLIGRLESECLEELKAQIEHSGTQVVLDLEEVGLVALDVVRFLNACQDGGVGIANSSPYIREWMLCEQKREE